MPKPSPHTFFRLTEYKIGSLRVPRPTLALATRPFCAAAHVQRPVSALAVHGLEHHRGSATIVHTRSMSTSADHQPSAKAAKAPAVPRPSSRYVDVCCRDPRTRACLICTPHEYSHIAASCLSRRLIKSFSSIASPKHPASRQLTSSLAARSAKLMMVRYQT